MTVTNPALRHQYSGDGAQKTFGYDNRIDDADHLLVYKFISGARVTLVRGADYTVTGVGSDGGGSVVLTSALAAGHILVILYDYPTTQTLDLTNVVRVFTEEHERALDRIVQAVLTLKEKVNRAVLSSEDEAETGFTLTQYMNQIKTLIAEAEGAAVDLPSNSLVLATGTTTTRSLADRFSGNSRVFNVRDFGAVGDGTTDDRAAIQAALNKGGQTYPVTVIIPAGRYKIGTDAAVNVESPLLYKSNTTIIVQGELLHYINNSAASLILCTNSSEVFGGTVYRDVHIIFTEGGKITFPTRTIGQARKGIGIANTENFSLIGLRTDGDDFGSFNITVWHSNYGVISGMNINAGNGVGEDGLHFLGNCKGITVTGNTIFSGDDAISFTQEGANFASCTLQNFQVTGNVLYTTNHSAVKILTNSSAASSVIKDLQFSGNRLGLTSSTNEGNLMVITNVAGNTIDNIRFRGTSGSMAGGYKPGAAVEITLATNIDLGDFHAKDLVGRGMFLDTVDGFKFGPGGHLGGYSGRSTFLTGLTITGVTYVSAQLMRVQFSGSPDLSTLSASTDYVNVSGCANAINNGRFSISAINNTSKYLDVRAPFSRSATQDETSLSLAATITRGNRSDFGMHIIGGSNIEIVGNTFDNVGSFGINLLANGASVFPKFGRIADNNFFNFLVDEPISVTATYFRIEGNRAFNCNARYFIHVQDNTGCEYNEVYNNADIGDTSTCKNSFLLARTTTLSRNNRGSNSDFLAGQVTILSGTTSITIPAGFDVFANYGTTNVERNLIVSPASSLGSATKFWHTYNTSTRVFTLNVDVNPGADVKFNYRIERYN